MKKLYQLLKKKCTVVNLMNLCALALLLQSVNTTCVWAHHQPNVPEEAKRFRKF